MAVALWQKRARPLEGFMLLEVVIAIGLLVLGLAVIGAQIQQSSFRAHRTDEIARVVSLAESKIAEIDTGLVEPEQEIEDEFGRLFPEYAWRITLEQAGVPDLWLVKLEILRDPTRDIEQDFDFDVAQVEGVYYMLRLTPRRLDLTTDFGMEDEQAEKLNENLSSLGGDAIDVHDFDPSLFKNLDMDQIAQMLPILMQAFGMKGSELLNLLPPEMQQQFQSVLQDTNPDELQQEAEDALNELNPGSDSDADQQGTGDTTGGANDQTGAGTGGPDQNKANDSSNSRGTRGGQGARGGRRGSRSQRGGGR